MTLSVFEYSDYKSFLRARIKDVSQSIPSYKTKLASACGCSKSYLSAVINHEIQLTPDQAYGLSRYWKFDEGETDYFMLLVAKDRASSLRFRSDLDRRAMELRKKNERIEKRVGKSKIESESFHQEYYSNWHFGAIHMLLTIPEYQCVDKLAVKIGLAEEQLRRYLETLKEQGLACETDDGLWQALEKQTHLGEDSHLVPIFHHQLRQQAFQSAVRKSSEQSDAVRLHYSAMHTISRGDALKLKEMWLQTLEQSSEAVETSSEEELFCVNLDFFQML